MPRRRADASTRSHARQIPASWRQLHVLGSEKPGSPGCQPMIGIRKNKVDGKIQLAYTNNFLKCLILRFSYIWGVTESLDTCNDAWLPRGFACQEAVILVFQFMVDISFRKWAAIYLESLSKIQLSFHSNHPIHSHLSPFTMSSTIASSTGTATSTASATATCTSAVPDKNGYTPPDACGAIYPYYPSFAAAILFSILFGAATVSSPSIQQFHMVHNLTCNSSCTSFKRRSSTR